MRRNETSRITRTETALLIASILAVAGCRLVGDEGQGKRLTAAEEIRIEATRANDDPAGRPLPLIGSWTCGNYNKESSFGWSAENQIRLIEEGHHLLPWFANAYGTVSTNTNDFTVKYYKAAIERARDLKLPLTFLASQWESGLSGKPYVDLPAAENPNVVTTEGKIQPRVSPFGPVAPWRQIGRTHTDNPWMKQLQEWYPDPPLVVFISNNEHGKLTWGEVETEQRYIAQYGKGKDDNFKRKVVAEGWIERYRALQSGLREGLQNDSWKKNSIYIGYDAFGPPFFGRWGGWKSYALCIEGRIDSSPLTWDGGSPSYYTDDWQPRRDYKVWSPQVEFMNLVFMQREAFRLNPKFWFEFSIWDGYQYGSPKSTRAELRKAGQTVDPERYAGLAQFGMWLLRPRVVRDFRGWTEPWVDVPGKDGKETWEGGGAYFMALVESADRVYTNPILRQWWRKGELVANRAHPHPYGEAIPAEYREMDRWFLLDTSADPKRPWSLHTSLPVFSLALTQGKSPARQWLVYAHAPLGEVKSVAVMIPDYKPVTIDVQVGGVFYRVDEKRGTVVKI